MINHELTSKSKVEKQKENRFVLILDPHTNRCALSIGITSHFIHQQQAMSHLNDPVKHVRIEGFYTHATKQASVTGINDLPVQLNNAKTKAELKLIFEAFNHHKLPLDSIVPNEEHGNMREVTLADLQ